jgi:hypothetical protein
MPIVEAYWLEVSKEDVEQYDARGFESLEDPVAAQMEAEWHTLATNCSVGSAKLTGIARHAKVACHSLHYPMCLSTLSSL